MMDAPRRRFTRRDFLEGSLAWPALAALFTAGITVSCADSSSDGNGSSDDSSPTCGAADCAISSNHGHTVEITQAQLDAASAVTLTLTVGNSHTHSLDLTAAEVQDIADGTTVSATSSSDSGHTHTVTFN